MKISIIKYNAGNIRSVDFALQRLGVEATITADPQEIIQSDKVIFPGVGEASTTMAYLKEHGLDKLITNLRQPVLGICLGLQLMCSHSEEGDVDCLGIFAEKVKKFVIDPANPQNFKVPHMGWNNLEHLSSPLFKGMNSDDYFYFVHSYYATKGEHSAAVCNYMVPFSAALHRDNFYATQFHPEKSGNTGSKILRNFLDL